MNDSSYDRAERDRVDDERVAGERAAGVASDQALRSNVDRGTIEAGDKTGFFPDDLMADFRKRWDDVQAGFVDDPRAAVQQANCLVEGVVDQLTATFTSQRDELESQWTRGDVDTEALRVALQRYRAFFNRLLAR